MKELEYCRSASGHDKLRIAAVIPCYRVATHVLRVIETTLALSSPEVDAIYVVDDCCPEHTGELVEQWATDPRVIVLRHEKNKGVGGAVMTGYRRGMQDKMDILVKIDGDGQMDPRLLPRLVRPLRLGHADYVKGNRFYDLSHIRRMPLVRIFGNAVLSFLAKLSTGYWFLFDPTNGYTAITSKTAAIVPLEKLSNRFFFETDLLFRLNIVRAVVVDVPMHAAYGAETSNLKVFHILGEFLVKHLRNLLKRIFYNYYLRDLNIASMELLVGAAMIVYGVAFGGWYWAKAVSTGMPTPVGTVMLAALPILLGVQLILAFLAYDIANVPRRPITQDLDGPDGDDA